MLPPGWEIATLIAKWLIYLATAMQGGVLLYLKFHDDGSRRVLQRQMLYLLVAALLGFHAALVVFLCQVGLINGRGLAGMFDWSMASFMLETPVGEATLWRLTGFAALLLIAALMLWRIGRMTRPPALWLRNLLLRLLLFAMLVILNSYRLSGHLSVLPLSAQLALLVHVFVFACWIGSLPLFLAQLPAQSAPQLRHSMEVFGNQALGLVVVLTLAGVWMLVALLQSPLELFTSAWGQHLLLKFVLVTAILVIAALNRYRFVPALSDQHSCAALRRSLRWEVGVALAILAVTAYLSTLIGPPAHA